MKNNQFLVLDTAFFSEDFKDRLISSIDNLDETLDGLLIHGDNFQALNLLQEKYKEQIQCVYIDPPYNTENNDFNYKDNYKHSSWLSMMYDRLEKMKPLMNEKGVFFSSIDDNEVDNLKKVSNIIFRDENFVGNLIWQKKKGGSQDSQTFAKEHEYIVSYDIGSWKINNLTEEYSLNSFSKIINGRNAKLLKLEKWGNHSLRVDRPSLYYSIKDPLGNDFFPIAPNGEEGCWRKKPENIDEAHIYWQKDSKDRLIPYEVIYYDEMINKEKIIKVRSILLDYGTTTDSAKERIKLFNDKNSFTYSKPLSLIKLLINLASYNLEENTILDFFAGSGTTGHAVINLNREDGGNRKYILVEMGEYFDTVTKPRIQKVIYSKDWKDGKPVSREGSSHAFKYIRLESYEDTLNNVKFNDTPLSLDDERLYNEYLVNYMIKKESGGSIIYLPAEAFYHPFDFKLKITNKNECSVKNVDLVETFNYLIGLNTHAIYTGRYNADFKEAETGMLTAFLKKSDQGKYVFKFVEGQSLENEKILIIWRNIAGDITNEEDMNKNNAVLTSLLKSREIKTTDGEFDIIYVNCNNSLQNISTESGYKVALIEEVMKEKMFNIK